MDMGSGQYSIEMTDDGNYLIYGLNNKLIIY